jgi:glycosyltransferase involved in cell wall biosynthesis
LVVNTLPETDISGVGEQVVQLAAGLRELGHEVRILGRRSTGISASKLLFPLCVVPEFWRAARDFRPHVVQVHESDGAMVALVVRTLQAVQEPRPVLVALQQVSYLEEIRAVRPIRVAGRVLGRPGLKELRFRWLKAPMQVLFGCLTAYLADRRLAPSRQTAEEIERDYRVDSVKVLPNVTGAREVAAPGRASETGDSLLFVGRLRVRKGVEVLLHAAEKLRRRRPGTRLVIVGEGEHRRRLERTARSLSLDGAVEFRGACPPEEIPRLMASARALVVPSIYEGMPLVILEAMAAGLPVVASSVSGIPEVVEDGESGWLVPPEDVEALVEALEEALADPGEAHRRGQSGRRWVEAAANPVEAARQWLALVEEQETRAGGS